MVENPCRYCKPPKRSPTCHGVCQEYILWAKENTKQRQKIQIKRQSDRIADNDYHNARKRRK